MKRIALTRALRAALTVYLFFICQNVWAITCAELLGPDSVVRLGVESKEFLVSKKNYSDISVELLATSKKDITPSILQATNAIGELATILKSQGIEFPEKLRIVIDPKGSTIAGSTAIGLRPEDGVIEGLHEFIHTAVFIRFAKIDSGFRNGVDRADEHYIVNTSLTDYLVKKKLAILNKAEQAGRNRDRNAVQAALKELRDAGRKISDAGNETEFLQTPGLLVSLAYNELLADLGPVIITGSKTLDRSNDHQDTYFDDIVNVTEWKPLLDDPHFTTRPTRSVIGSLLDTKYAQNPWTLFKVALEVAVSETLARLGNQDLHDLSHAEMNRRFIDKIWEATP